MHSSRWLTTSAESPGTLVAHLQSRAVLQAEGAQALAFLQGLVTNDVRPLEAAGPSAPPVYAAILTPKGKLLHDVFIYRHPEAKDALLLEVDASGAAAAMQLLNRYKLRRAIAFKDVSSSYTVMAAWAPGGAAAPPQPAGPWWRPDPRLPQLGFRALLPTGSGGGGSSASEDDYRALRYRHGVAEGETEMPTGQAAPLDYNLDALHGVSYTKGCYVGQERNSFTHYRGIIRKRLMPVRLSGEGGPGGAEEEPGAGPSSQRLATLSSLAPGAEVVDSATGQSVGQLRGAAGGWGIAYLKLQQALAAEAGHVHLHVSSTGGVGGQAEGAAGGAGDAGQGGAGGPGGRGVRVVPVRPEWWLPEWGHEEEGQRVAGAKEAGKGEG